MFFKKKLIISVFVIAVMALCFSCASTQPQALFNNKRDLSDSIKSDDFARKTYKIKPQDLLQIRNLQNPKYIVDEPNTNSTATTNQGNSEGQAYRVSDDSTVTLPIIGLVKVAGLSRAEAAAQIEALYRKDLKNPIIEVKIINLKVTLLGEITKQGNYALTKDRTTLIEVIGEAGGLTEKANSKNLKIIRGAMGNQQVIDVDLSNINTLSDPRTILQNNDVIYVAQNKQAVRTKNTTGFSAILQPIVLLLNTALIIYTLTK